MMIVGASRNGKSRVAGMVLRSLLALVFFAAAFMKFAAVEFEVSNFAHFGYAPWFMVLIGVLEFAGAVLLLFRPLAALGAASMAVIMVGAAFSHLHAGDGIAMAAPALVLLVLLVLAALSHRHAWMASRVVVPEAEAA